MHATRQYASTTITCRYTVPQAIRDQCASAASSNQPLRDAFFLALARTVLEHPALQVGQINEDSRSPAWVELDTVDLHQHVEWTLVKPDDDDFEALLRQTIGHNLDTFFDHLETKPGWRLAVLQREDDTRAIEVVLAWNHSNFDGTGAKIFHKTLLRNLNRNGDDDDTINWAKPGILKLDGVAARFPARVTKLGKFTTSKKWALEFGWKNLKPSAFRGHSQYDTDWAPVRVSPLSTVSRTFFVESAELPGLLRACRARKTTITGLLMALGVASLAVQSRTDGVINGAQLEGVAAHTAMDLRRHLPKKSERYPWLVPDELLSNIVSVTIHEFDASLVQSIRDAALNAKSEDELLASIDKPLWDIAARTRQDLEGRLNEGLHNEILPMMNIVPDWRTEHKHHVTKPRPGGVLVTNLGVLDGGDKTDNASWGIESARFQLSAAVTTPPFQISAISVKGGDMCVDINWQPGVLPEAITEQFYVHLQSWIHALAKVEA